MSYQESLTNKILHITDLFPSELVHPIVETSLPFFGRAKTKWAVGGSLEELKLGFPDHKGHVQYDLRQCPQHQEHLKTLGNLLTEGMTKYRIPPYDVATKKGELKFITLVKANDTNEILIRYTLRSRECLERLKKMHEDLKQLRNDLVVASATIQPVHMAKRDGDTEIFLTERHYIQESIHNLTLLYGPHSFIQASSYIKSKLYQKAAEIFQRIKGHNVLDLYCGTGAFALHLAKDAKYVRGIEIANESITLAQKAAKLNGLENIEFTVLNADNLVGDTYEINKLFDTFAVNPPRRGLSPQLINLIINSSCTHLIYSSCNPESLKRDMDLLAVNFQLTELTPFDMFPFTPHLECLALFKRQ